MKPQRSVRREEFVAFEPFAPRFPFETAIMPKQHWTHFENMEDRHLSQLAQILKPLLKKIEEGLRMPPYNFVLHSAPFYLGKPEHYHWHIDVIPRLTTPAGFEWGSGFHINPVPPEDAAEFLREAP